MISHLAFSPGSHSIVPHEKEPDGDWREAKTRERHHGFKHLIIKLSFSKCQRTPVQDRGDKGGGIKGRIMQEDRKRKSCVLTTLWAPVFFFDRFLFIS